MQKQAYKLELFNWWRIYDIFYMLLREQNIIKKRQVNNLLESEPKLDIGKDKKYKVKVIKNSAIYTTEVVRDKLPELH